MGQPPSRASWRLYDPRAQVLFGSSRRVGTAWYAPRCKTPVRGFSLLEIMGVIFLLALLLAIGLPYLSRMRANTTINTNAERAAGFLTQAQSQAKTFGVPIPTELLPPVEASDPVTTDGVLAMRMRQRRIAGEDPVTVRFAELARLEVMNINMVNIPNLDMGDQPNLVGTVVEFGTGVPETEFEAFASIAFDSNGTIPLPDTTQLGQIRLGRLTGDPHIWRIELAELGKIALRKDEIPIVQPTVLPTP